MLRDMNKQLLRRDYLLMFPTQAQLKDFVQLVVPAGHAVHFNIEYRRANKALLLAYLGTL